MLSVSMKGRSMTDAIGTPKQLVHILIKLFAVIGFITVQLSIKNESNFLFFIFVSSSAPALSYKMEQTI